MLLGGFVFSVLVLWAFVWGGYFTPPLTNYLLSVGIIAVAITIVESLPFSDVDNITIPLVSVLIGLLVF